MSIEMLPVRNLSGNNALFPRGAYEAKETLSSPGNGSWIIVEPGIAQLNIDLIITAGEGYVESTNDHDGAIEGTAEGFKWDLGNVTINSQAAAVGVSAVRAVNVSGTVKIIANGVV